MKHSLEPLIHAAEGWVSPIRLRNGDWGLGFSAGDWHAPPPDETAGSC